ncbi:involucrin-like [Mya arenaria]|uniref:involucrin-like n=1 Tax=Mya arenaria TaxID=6604 RepID=UPI0022E6AD81|nr:involucrin-like [Mya arenaria]
MGDYVDNLEVTSAGQDITNAFTESGEYLTTAVASSLELNIGVANVESDVTVETFSVKIEADTPGAKIESVELVLLQEDDTTLTTLTLEPVSLTGPTFRSVTGDFPADFTTGRMLLRTESDIETTFKLSELLIKACFEPTGTTPSPKGPGVPPPGPTTQAPGVGTTPSPTGPGVPPPGPTTQAPGAPLRRRQDQEYRPQDQPHSHQEYRRQDQPHSHQVYQRQDQPHSHQVYQRQNQPHSHQVYQRQDQPHNHQVCQRQDQPHSHQVYQRQDQPHSHLVYQRQDQPHRHQELALLRRRQDQEYHRQDQPHRHQELAPLRRRQDQEYHRQDQPHRHQELKQEQ